MIQGPAHIAASAPHPQPPSQKLRVTVECLRLPPCPSLLPVQLFGYPDGGQQQQEKGKQGLETSGGGKGAAEKAPWEGRKTGGMGEPKDLLMLHCPISFYLK